MSTPRSLLITPVQFTRILKDDLGPEWSRALVIFDNFGERLSIEVTNALIQAVDSRNVEEVLKALEEYFERYLSKDPPEARGTRTHYDQAFFIRLAGMSPAAPPDPHPL